MAFFVYLIKLHEPEIGVLSRKQVSSHHLIFLEFEWMGIEPMPTKPKDQVLTTRPGDAGTTTVISVLRCIIHL
jgi:hypothetical protein